MGPSKIESVCKEKHIKYLDAKFREDSQITLKCLLSSVENVSGGWSDFCLKVFDTLQTKYLPPSIKSFRIIHTKQPPPPPLALWNPS